MTMPRSMEPGAPVAAGAIPLSVPYIHGREWEYVKETLDTGWVSSVGPFVTRLETEFAAAVGAHHAVAVGSGTAALHIALVVSGIGAGDEVILPSLTFIAPANAIRYTGAWPVLLDVDPDTYQLDPNAVAEFLSSECARDGAGVLRNRHTGRAVRAILPVDLIGHPVYHEPLERLDKSYGLQIIEDATESLGAHYRGRKVGSFPRFACFSFNGNKLLTTGGGGMLVVHDEALAKRARYLTTQAKDDPVEFVHGAVGYNYRLTNVQAAIGCAQLEQLDAFLEKKRRIRERYLAAFADIEGITPQSEASWARSAHWLFTVRVNAARFGSDSRQLMSRLGERAIQARPFWQPLHLSPAMIGSWASACSIATELNRECLSLPCSVGLTDEEQERVIDAVRHASKSGLAES